MNRSRTRLALIATVAASAIALSACAGDAESTSNGSDEDRSLIVYSGRDESLIGPIIEKFEEESGIEVKVRYANSIEMAAQLLEEGERTPAQVFLSQEAGALGELANADLLAPLPEEITGAVAPQYSAADDSWVALTGRARVLLYDSESVSEDEVPSDVHALTEPEWQGRVGFAPTNASFQSFVTAMRVLEGEDVAEEWLTGMIDNDTEVFDRNGPIVEAVNTGALDVGLVNHYYWVVAAAEAGGPESMRAQLKFGEPGTVSALVNVTGAGVLASAEDSDEAQEFVEYLVSEQAQEHFVEEAGEYSLLPDGPSPADVPSLDELDGPDLDFSELADLDGTLELLQKVGLL